MEFFQYKVLFIFYMISIGFLLYFHRSYPYYDSLFSLFIHILYFHTDEEVILHVNIFCTEVFKGFPVQTDNFAVDWSAIGLKY